MALEDTSTVTPNVTTEDNTAKHTSVGGNNYSQVSGDGTQTTSGTSVDTTEATRPDQSNVMTTGQNNTTTAPTTTTNTTVATPQTSSVTAQRPSDFVDDTVNQYYADYQNGVATGNYLESINALQGLDQYRQANGYSALYTNTILELNNELNANNAQTSQYGSNTASEYLANLQPYNSVFLDSINNIVAQIYTAQFTYDPSSDLDLMKAQQYATNTVYESMNSKGILDSTMTAQMITNTVNNLVEKYRTLAKQDWEESINRLVTVANMMVTMDNTMYKRWQDNVNMRLEYYESLKDEQEYQWDRVEKLGYVDNEASKVLGVEVGMMSPSKRTALEEYNRSINKIYVQLAADKELATYKTMLSNIAKVATTENKYGTSSTTGTAYVTDSVNILSDNDNGVGMQPVNQYTTFTGVSDESTLVKELTALEGESSAYKILYAYEHAKDFESFKGAISKIPAQDTDTGNAEFYTLEQANKIIAGGSNLSSDDKANYFDALYKLGYISADTRRGNYETNGLDWKTDDVEYNNALNALKYNMAQCSTKSEARNKAAQDIIDYKNNPNTSDYVANALYDYWLENIAKNYTSYTSNVRKATSTISQTLQKATDYMGELTNTNNKTSKTSNSNASLDDIRRSKKTSNN